MSEPKFDLVKAKKKARAHKSPQIHWDWIFDAIEPGMAAVFDRDDDFIRKARQTMTRRRSLGGMKDIYTYVDGDKFYIAREETE